MGRLAGLRTPTGTHSRYHLEAHSVANFVALRPMRKGCESASWKPSESIADPFPIPYRRCTVASSLPSSSMSAFLTVKEAAQRTGKSSSSIRRAFYPIIKNDAHPDRAHIEPSIEEALKLRVKGEGFAWRISQEWLQREIPAEPETPDGATTAHAASDSSAAELLAMLQRELAIKNAQITRDSELLVKLTELVSGLSERLREGNILIGSLQQQLTLTDGRDSKLAEPVKVRTVTPVKTEKGTAAPKANKLKRGLFSRLFRKKS